MKSSAIKVLFATAMLALMQSVAWSAEPTINEIYTLANSGRVLEAQQQMQQVLRNHPGSWKAHFVEAELLARQNQLSGARAEFAAAERLSPGLPSESRESVQKLRAQLFSGAPAMQSRPVQRVTNGPSFSWGPIVIGALLLIIVVMMIRSFMRRAAAPSMNSPMNAPMNTMGAGNFGNNNAGGFGSGMQPMSGGMGGGLMGSLATGAALGAGLVAGEALAHKLAGGDAPNQRFAPASDNFSDSANSDLNVDQNVDMGGDDFGISDASSWDSGGGDGGGGWD